MLISQHWIILILGIPGVLLSYICTIGTDKNCIEKIGNDYKEYMKRVPGINIFLGLWRLLSNKKRDY